MQKPLHCTNRHQKPYQHKCSFCTTPCILSTYIQTYKQNHIFSFAFFQHQKVQAFIPTRLFIMMLQVQLHFPFGFSPEAEKHLHRAHQVLLSYPQTYWNILTQTLNQNTAKLMITARLEKPNSLLPNKTCVYCFCYLSS